MFDRNDSWGCKTCTSHSVTKLSPSYEFDELLRKISSYNFDPNVNLWVNDKILLIFLPLDDRFQTQILSSFFQLHLAQIKTPIEPKFII